MPGVHPPVGEGPGGLPVLWNGVLQMLREAQDLQRALASVMPGLLSAQVAAGYAESFTPTDVQVWQGATPSVTAQIGSSGCALVLAQASCTSASTSSHNREAQIGLSWTPSGGSQTGPAQLATFGTGSLTTITLAGSIMGIAAFGFVSSQTTPQYPFPKLPSGQMTFSLGYQDTGAAPVGVGFTDVTLVVWPF